MSMKEERKNYTSIKIENNSDLIMKDNVVALIIYSNNDFGGAERRLIRIYNKIGEKKRVHIIVRGSSELDFQTRLEKADCSISNIEKVQYFQSNFKCLMYLFFNREYKCYHYFDLCGFNEYLAILAHLLGRPTILTVAYQNHAYGLVNNNIKKKLSRLVTKSGNVDVLFPIGKEYLKSISNNKNITVTPGTFTDLDLFVPADKKKIILFAAARLERDKNAELLVEASNLIKDSLRSNGYKVVICGKGFQEEKLRETIETYTIEDIVEMPGYVKISEIMPYAELFVCIDLIDNYPSQTIAEAVACGCGLLLTDVGFSRKCGDDTFCYYVKNDAVELAEAIKQYVQSNQYTKQQISNAARMYAEKYYSIESSVNYFLKLIGGE